MLTRKGDSGLDYETFGAVDLRRHGLDRYVNHSSFRPLIVSVVGKGNSLKTFDFVFDGQEAISEYIHWLGYTRMYGNTLFAHNAGFERAVTGWIMKNWNLADEPKISSLQFADTAVISRTEGAAGALAGAARQLTSQGKLETGSALIQIFCVPNDWNKGVAPTKELILNTPGMLEKWKEFIHYCEVDARAGLYIADNPFTDHMLTSQAREIGYEHLTSSMNQIGWNVDLDLVHEMKQRYERNLDRLIAEFHQEYDPKYELNLNSPIQLKGWCEKRGIRTKSFDRDSVLALEEKLRTKLASMDETETRFQDYTAVHAMLVAKQEMGGSSLKKLQVILDQTGADGRLRDQYVHCGAGQTFRTSGRGVQMQNLKRLSGELFPMETLYDPDVEADNTLLAQNLRQVFTASHPNGELIVGDFSSVESRGLAWLAGADWKIDAFRQGKDLYKVLAANIYDIPYEEVDKAQRQTGKVGELSCGYGSGGDAVASFAQGMGIDMTPPEGQGLVNDWRSINKEIVEMWATLDEGLEAVVLTGAPQRMKLGNGLRLQFSSVPAPFSLTQQHPGARSIIMSLYHVDREGPILQRVFHGVYKRGSQICYYKPSERIHGDAWSDEFTDRKTKEKKNFTLYGGKITGILTQSMCREMFFESIMALETDLMFVRNAPIVGQFHDEIVVDWVPEDSEAFPQRISTLYSDEWSLDRVLRKMETAMSTPPDWAKGFPLDADIKHAFRYIK